MASTFNFSMCYFFFRTLNHSMVNVASSCWGIIHLVLVFNIYISLPFTSWATMCTEQCFNSSLAFSTCLPLQSYYTCQGPTVLLELAGEEALPLGHLLVPGLQYSLLVPRVHGQGVRVGLVDVGPHSLQAVGVLQLPAHHAHQQLVERIVVHEVAVPPHDVCDRTFITVIILIVRKQKLWLIWREREKLCDFQQSKCTVLGSKLHSWCFTFYWCCVMWVWKWSWVSVHWNAVKEREHFLSLSSCIQLKAQLILQDFPPH